MQGREIVVGMSGGSGALVARSVLSALAACPEVAVLDIVASSSALRVFDAELGIPSKSTRELVGTLALAGPARIQTYEDEEIDAPISSGSHRTAGMVVVPCSGGTLGAIAHGISRGLVQRAADVHLKERRTLLLAFRETPLSLVHIENLAAVTRAGAIAVPPMPAFYLGADVERWIAHYVMRLFDLLGLPAASDGLRWKE